jgi:hypothetical protein
MLDKWNDEGGNVGEDDEFEEDNDREPRLPIAPHLNGGAALPIPEEEKELALV